MAAYLDHNASSVPRPRAVAAAAAALALTGNASSVHAQGRAARRIVEQARAVVAALVGGKVEGVVFTSGGSEANALAVAGFGRPRLLVGATEHASLRNLPGAGPIPVDGEGIIDLTALEGMLANGGDGALVCVMLANNETGVIQPVAEAASICHGRGALLHCDAVQAAGKLAIDLAALGADSLALAAHKLGGPPGTGALVLARPDRAFNPMLRGGGQESGRRAGTENLPGIAGFAAAIENLDLAAEAGREAALRERIEAGVRRLVPEACIIAEHAPRLPNTSSVALPGRSARSLLIALDLAGVAVSAGAACAAGRFEPSPVLIAMGEAALAGSAIRISTGWNSTEGEVDEFLSAFASLAPRLAKVA